MGGFPHLSVERLALARGGRVLIDALSFEAVPGALIAVRGANGVGKTSLLRALAGFLPIAGGRIARAAPLHFLGHRDGIKGALSVEAHVSYWAGLLGEGRRRDDALARVGLAALVGAPARILSQGQSRRLALARLLVAPRPLWLLDEPAASLDSAGQSLLAELLAAHRREGGAVIAALHEPLRDSTPSLTLELGV